MRSNPLIRELIVDGEIRRIELQLDDTTAEGDLIDDYSESAGAYGRVLPQPDKWVESEAVWINDPDIIRGVFRSVLFVTQAREAPVASDDTMSPSKMR
ncbi:hypothetical protein [Halorubrum tebenquichense]|uniref:Uncharacterized protein n=1 Tax=Halorubrum tebenquichense DSM 14210 TaxID=1227485 RepID=M0DCC6_9EURY|nr:hypothetical protein [Halorubrum tebenquichense]ELZ32397.1 hypothetical protein C472_15724 [Halorubrum tebenquichense DSM 14210]